MKFQIAQFRFTGPDGQPMPRKISGPKKNGQMYVTIAGKQQQIGSWRHPDLVKENYWRLLAERLSPGNVVVPAAAGLSVEELCEQYMRWAKPLYQKRGRPTSSIQTRKAALKHLLRHFAGTPANNMRQRPFAVFCGYLIDLAAEGKLVGNTVNVYRGIIIETWKWGANRGMVAADCWREMEAAPKATWRDRVQMTNGVTGVPEEVLAATLPHLHPRHRAMIQLMAWSACRPIEARSVRTCDVHNDDPIISGSVRERLEELGKAIWIYRVAADYDKTAHKTTRPPRIIFLPSEAQEVLDPWFDLENQERYLFSHSDGDSPVGPSSLGQAIRSACKRHDIPPWGSNRLRHRAATRLAKAYGLEMARVLLGHADVTTTLGYVDQDIVSREDYDSIALALAGVKDQRPDG